MQNTTNNKLSNPCKSQEYIIIPTLLVIYLTLVVELNNLHIRDLNNNVIIYLM